MLSCGQSHTFQPAALTPAPWGSSILAPLQWGLPPLALGGEPGHLSAATMLCLLRLPADSPQAGADCSVALPERMHELVHAGMMGLRDDGEVICSGC